MTYLNIFNYEPRRSKVGVDEKENNVTRAFLTTLQKSPHFSKHFFSKLDIDLQKKVSYTFQTNQKEVNTLKRRTRKHYFLYISKENPFELEGNNNTTNPLPDGLINDEKNIILLEAKVNAPKDKSQKNNYKKKFFDNNCIEKEITWEDIHKIIKLFLLKNSSSINTIERFILEEFKRYMEAINLNSFDGISFYKNDENYDEIIAKQTLKLLRLEYPKFKDINLATPTRPLESNWDPIRLSTKKEKRTHYTISFNEYSFNIDIMTFGDIGKKVVKHNYKQFIEYVKELSNNVDYYLELVDYHKIKNKRLEKGQNHVQRGKDYNSLLFSIQLYKLVNQKNWEEKLKQIMETHLKSGIKNLQIQKRFLYIDDYYKEKIDMSNRETALNEIENTLKDLKSLYLLFSESEK